jgi:hypothetical protein
MYSATKYISVYFYTYGFDENRVLRDYLDGLVQDLLAAGLVGNWFFIRYNDKRGRHLRLRVLPTGQNGESEIKRRVEQSFAKYSSNIPAQGDRDPFLWYADYIPETQRYGGQASLSWCEQYFRYSSETALEILRRQPDIVYDGCFSQALAANLIFLYHLRQKIGRSKLHELLEQAVDAWLYSGIAYVKHMEWPKMSGQDNVRLMEGYAQLFLQQKEDIFRLLTFTWDICEEEDHDEQEPMAIWSRENASVINGLRRLSPEGLGIDPATLFTYSSLMHMTNNRLGVLNRDESYMNYIFMQFMDALHT